jgi:hypothetical protein
MCDLFNDDDLTDVDLFFAGELEWDQLSKADQRTIRDELDEDTPY